MSYVTTQVAKHANEDMNHNSNSPFLGVVEKTLFESNKQIKLIKNSKE
jgi:hypothetical protein